MEKQPSRWCRLRIPLLRLQGSNCQECGRKHFPERRMCPDCGHDNQMSIVKLGVNVRNEINPRIDVQNGN